MCILHCKRYTIGYLFAKIEAKLNEKLMLKVCYEKHINCVKEAKLQWEKKKKKKKKKRDVNELGSLNVILVCAPASGRMSAMGLGCLPWLCLYMYLLIDNFIPSF
jgi:hypothetical protein